MVTLPPPLFSLLCTAIYEHFHQLVLWWDLHTIWKCLHCGFIQCYNVYYLIFYSLPSNLLISNFLTAFLITTKLTSSQDYSGWLQNSMAPTELETNYCLSTVSGEPVAPPEHDFPSLKLNAPKLHPPKLHQLLQYNSIALPRKILPGLYLYINISTSTIWVLMLI